MNIVVIPGDGIGPETMAATLDVLAAADRRFGLGLALEHEIAGHASLERHGATVTPDLLAKVKAADGLMLGPMATFDFKDETKGEINPSKFFRKELDLYANIRPARTYPGVAHKVDDFDLVVVRENTEGFYADRNVASGGSEMLITDDVVVSLRRITRVCCERVARAAFELATTRRHHVTIVHKANVLKLGDGMFIEECQRVAKEFADVEVDAFIVDAMMAHVVRAPQRFDVIVTTNMFGDILSDLTAELSGSLGLGGSLNAGRDHAMGQAQHGSAPDIAGRDIANPLSLVLSAAPLLAWHGQRRGLSSFIDAARAIEGAVVDAVTNGEATRDVGGRLGTADTGRAVARRLAAGPAMNTLPAGACDCHTHVFCDRGLYPMAVARHYTPGPAPVDDLRAHLDRLGLSRVVLVQPSVYGTDNRCLLDALDVLGPDVARGVVVLDETATDHDLDALHARGVRGLRLNLESTGARDPLRIRAALAQWSDRLAQRGWHLQIFCALDTLMSLADDFAKLPCRIVFDHFAMIGVGMEPDAEPARTLLALLADRRVHVKLSGAYRIAPGVPGKAEALARRWSTIFRETAPTQLVWASDWPHTDREPGKNPHEVSRFRDVASGTLARSVADWLPDESDRRQVLVDNPAALYDF